MLTAFDVGVGVLVLISAILATARGLTREVLSLATWAGSAAIAIYMLLYHPDIAHKYIAEEVVANIATVIVTFIVALIVLHLLTMRIADFVVDSKIGPLDRTLGFIFGVLRGLLIAVVVVIFGTWLLGEKLPPWAKDSQSLPHLDAAGKTLISMLPQNLQDQVNDILKGKATKPDDSTGPADAAAPTDEDQTDSTEDSTVPAAPGAAPAKPAAATPAKPV